MALNIELGTINIEFKKYPSLTLKIVVRQNDSWQWRTKRVEFQSFCVNPVQKEGCIMQIPSALPPRYSVVISKKLIGLVMAAEFFNSSFAHKLCIVL